MSVISFLFGEPAGKKEPRSHHYIVEDPTLRPACLEVLKLHVEGLNRTISVFKKYAEKEGTGEDHRQKTAALIGWPVPLEPLGLSGITAAPPAIILHKNDLYVTVPNLARVARAVKALEPYAEMARQWRPPPGLRKIEKLPRGAALVPSDRDLAKAGLPGVIPIRLH